jgi:hypothetical protein
MKGNGKAAARLRAVAVVLPVMPLRPRRPSPERRAKPLRAAPASPRAPAPAPSHARESPVRYAVTPYRPQLACEPTRGLPAPADVAIP